MHIVRHNFKYYGQRMQWTSIRSNAAISGFVLYRACGRTCTVEKGLGPLHRPAFPRGIKSSCGRPGACQSKNDMNYGKMLNSVLMWTRREAFRNASKLPYLRKARASALRFMQLPAVCYARRNHGKNKMSAKCLLQIICIQSVNETFLWTWIDWQKFRLSTLVLEIIVESLTHACQKWS